MTHGSLFSGIGGFDLAAHWAGIQNVFACEIDEFCRKVLNKRFPNTTLYQDIKETNFAQFNGRVDIITGGFPCQPFSIAGKRTGTKDNRYLWGEMLRVVREIKPKWVIAENVRGLLSINDGNTFETVCNDLEISGYEVQPFIIPALSVGAPHKRDRVWFIANRNDNKQELRQCDKTDGRSPQEPRCSNGTGTSVRGEYGNITEGTGFLGTSTGNLFAENLADSDSGRLERTEEERRQGEYALRSDSGDSIITDTPSERRERDNGDKQTTKQLTEYNRRENWNELWTEAITRIYGMDDGLPGGMDGLNQRYKHKSRRERIKTMGNSIVPQIAYQIFLSILDVEVKR